MFLSLIYIILLSVKASMHTDETENKVLSDNQTTIETHTEIKEEKDGVLSTSTDMQELESSQEGESSASLFTTLPIDHHAETGALESSVETNTLETLYEDDLSEESTRVTDIDESISSHINQYEKNSHETFPTNENFPTEETTSTILSTEIQSATEEAENEDDTESTSNENGNESINFNSSKSTNNITNEEASEHVTLSTANKKEDLTEGPNAESEETALNTELTNKHNESTTHTSHAEHHQEKLTSHVEASSESNEEQITSEELTTSTNFEEKENRTTGSTEENSSSENLTNQLNEHTTKLETTVVKTEENNTATRLEHYNETSESTIEEISEETSSATASTLSTNKETEDLFKTSLNSSYNEETSETTTEESAENDINSESIEKLNQTEEHSDKIHTTASYSSEETVGTLETSVEEYEENKTTLATHENKSESTSEGTNHDLTSSLEEETAESATTNTPNKEVETFQTTLEMSENTLESISEESHHKEVTLETTATTNGNLINSESASEETEVTKPQVSKMETYPVTTTTEENNVETEYSEEVAAQTLESYKEFEISTLEDQKSKSEHHETSTTHTNIGSIHTDLNSLNMSHGSDTTPITVAATHEIEKQPLDFETPVCDYCDQISDLLKTKLDNAKNSESSNELSTTIQHTVLKAEKTTEHSVSNVLTTIEMEKNVMEMETTPCLYCTTHISEITKESQQTAKHSSQKPVTHSEIAQTTSETNSVETSTLAEHGCSPEGGTRYETHSEKEKQNQSKHSTTITTKESYGTQKSSKVTEHGHSTKHTSQMANVTKEQNEGSNTPSREQAKEAESETTNENIFTSTQLYQTTNPSQIVNETNHEAASTEKILSTSRKTEEESTTGSSGPFKSGETTSKITKEVKNGFHNPIIIVVKVYKEQKLNKSILENILSSPLPEVSIEYADLRTERNSSDHTEQYSNNAEIDKTSKEINTQKHVELKNECTKDDFKNRKHCFCNISDYLTTLERKIESSENIKSKVNYCNSFFKVKKLVLKKTSSSRTYRSLIALDHTKPIGNVEFEGIEGIFEHNFDLPHKGRNFYNLPSETIKIPCTNESTYSSDLDKEIAYTWSFHPLSAATSETLPDKSKDITLHGLSLSKAGNYTCTIMKKESIEGKVWHKLEIITFPIYEIKLNIFYRINDSCSLQTGDDLKTYLPKVMSPILCANKREICHLDMERPRCLTREDDNYYNVSIQVKTSADVVFLIESNCDINCKLAFYENIVSMIYRNAEMVEHISVRSEINNLVQTIFTPHLEGNNKSAVTTKSPQVASICPAGFGLERSKQRVCVICPKNTFSRENQSFCRVCPSGQYQPNVGSEFCIPCNSPVDDTMCLRMLYTSTAIFKIYVAAAFGIVTILIIVIIIWTSGMKDNPEEKGDYFEDSLIRRPTNKHGNRGANARVPPQIPPPDF